MLVTGLILNRYLLKLDSFDSRIRREIGRISSSQWRFFGINEVLHFRFKGEMERMIKFEKAVYKLFKKISVYIFIKASRLMALNKLEIVGQKENFIISRLYHVLINLSK